MRDGTHRVRRILFVLLDDPAVWERVDDEGRLLGVTADTDVHGARLFGDNAHVVEERNLDVKAVRARHADPSVFTIIEQGQEGAADTHGLDPTGIAQRRDRFSFQCHFPAFRGRQDQVVLKKETHGAGSRRTFRSRSRRRSRTA